MQFAPKRSRLVSTIVCAVECALAIAFALVVGHARADGPVSITLDHFGVGDHFRSGDTVAARFVLRGELDSPTPIEIAWELPDGNGDIAQVTRRLVLDPGQPVTTWLYARIPPQQNSTFVMTEVYTVRVWEESNGTRVRELGSARISPASSSTPTVAVALNDDILGVVGTGRMGLDPYTLPAPGSSVIPSMNASTRIARGIRPQDMPDRWEGLSQFSALIWADGSPQALTGDAATALREWISRGGLFVVIVPETADPWGLTTPVRHPLGELMPRWDVQRNDAISIRALLPIVSQSERLLNPAASMPVLFFLEPHAGDPFERFILLPVPRIASTGFAEPRKGSLDGKTIAVTRAYGHGRITVIGLDVDGLNRRSLQTSGIPQADVFWNRVLGRRADTPSSEEYQRLIDAKRFLVTAPSFTDLGNGEVFSDIIEMPGEAALGILAAFLLFVAYWVIAGPGGFAILKWRKCERHAWMAFVATALSFGAGVWCIGAAMSSNQARIQHLTVLDSIARPLDLQPKDDPGWARATCWFGAFLPGYSPTTIALDPRSDRRNRLVAWSPPPGGNQSIFPNPARTALPVERPATLEVAARATTASFEAQWIGAIDRDWGRAPFTPDPLRPLEQRVYAGSPIRVHLSGLIEHAMPGPLRNVGFIHITPIRNPAPAADLANLGMNTPSDALPNIGRFAIMTEWNPRSPIEVSEIFYPGGPLGVDERIGDLAHALRARYEDPFKKDQLRIRLDALLTADRRRLFLDMLGLYNMLQPPEYIANPPEDHVAVRAERMIGRSIDLSPWFTTPCLIVFGYLDAASCPVPIEIDGQRVPSDGVVLVRTVFPLPLDERFAAPASD
ncbi:MAG: hypothetical protein EXS15_08120 [Phycisphaerales bacterium]|nr:hypothetical protein [Phycisphaerales bacterium]